MRREYRIQPGRIGTGQDLPGCTRTAFGSSSTAGPTRLRDRSENRPRVASGRHCEGTKTQFCHTAPTTSPPCLARSCRQSARTSPSSQYTRPTVCGSQS